MMAALLASPLLHGAVTGLLAAAAVDYQSFVTWKTFDAAKTYDWPTALWRWFQGAVIGFVSNAGLVGVTG